MHEIIFYESLGLSRLLILLLKLRKISPGSLVAFRAIGIRQIRHMVIKCVKYAKPQHPYANFARNSVHNFAYVEYNFA